MWAKQAEGALTPGEAAETRLRVTMAETVREPAVAAVEAAWTLVERTKTRARAE